MKSFNSTASINSLYRVANSPSLSLLFQASFTHCLFSPDASLLPLHPKYGNHCQFHAYKLCHLENHWLQTLQTWVHRHCWCVMDFTDTELTWHWHINDKCELTLKILLYFFFSQGWASRFKVSKTTWTFNRHFTFDDSTMKK